jgi:flavin reductase (DIM6/NTAB) family NADH-FMN oxidoreductase RutF
MYVEGGEFESRDFRRGLWRQTTTTVALLTCATEGRTNVMACEWAMMVSHSPVCFLVSVHPSHETHAMLEAAGEFGLNFCADTQAELSHVSGSHSLRDLDKWQLADFPVYPAHEIDAPMIDGSLVNVECRIVGKHTLGHTLYIGEAVWGRYDPTKHPLLFHDAKYWQLGPQVPKE